MTALYKPFGLLASVLGGLLAGTIFKQIWKVVTHEQDKPDATDLQRGWGQIITAAAVEGALFGAVKAITHRSTAVGFRRATGVWPGDVEGGKKAA